MVNKADSIVARLNTAVNQPEIHEASSKKSFTSKLESEDINATDNSIGQENNESEGWQNEKVHCSSRLDIINLGSYILISELYTTHIGDILLAAPKAPSVIVKVFPFGTLLFWILIQKHKHFY